MMARAADGPPSGESVRTASAMPRATFVHRQLDADDAGRGDEHLPARRSDSACAVSRCHLLRVLHAVGPGARVGAAAVDDDRADRAAPTAPGWSRDTMTGAACARLVVKTAAAEAGRSDAITARSSPPFALIPQATPAAVKPRGAVTLPSICS